MARLFHLPASPTHVLTKRLGLLPLDTEDKERDLIAHRSRNHYRRHLKTGARTLIAITCKILVNQALGQ